MVTDQRPDSISAAILKGSLSDFLFLPSFTK